MQIIKSRNNIFIHAVLTLSILAMFILPQVLVAQGSGTGKITGRIVDQQNGEEIPGAVVILDGTTIGDNTDFDGNYMIRNIKPGRYTVNIKCVGYANVIIENVQVKPNEVTKIDYALVSEAIQGEEQVIEAEVVTNTDAALLKLRQKSNSVSDAISSEAISNVGAGDAAGALKKITGGSVQGGKYPVMRGLSERYNETQMNGINLPTPDMERKAVHMDMFPTNLLDNIEVIKTYTPDKPGSFTGGLINIGTKSYPESFTLKVSSSTAYNTQTTGKEGFLTYAGGDSDWLGVDDGTRSTPGIIGTHNPPPSTAGGKFSSDTAHLIEEMADAFGSTQFDFDQEAPPTNSNYSFSIGNQSSLFGKEVGYLASLTYNRSYSFYDDGLVFRRKMVGQTLTTERDLIDKHGREEAIWGLMLGGSMKLNDNNELGLNFMRTQNGESKARYIRGKVPSHADNNDFISHDLSWTERMLNSYQINGQHYLPGFMNSATITWNGGYTFNSQNEPNLRRFTYEAGYNSETGDSVYQIRPSGYRGPTRIYRDMNADIKSFDMKVDVPFKGINELSGKFSFGSAYSEKSREYRKNEFLFTTSSYYRFNGDPDEFFNDDETGLLDSTYNTFQDRWQFGFGRFFHNASTDRHNYDASEKITAFFWMLDFPLSNKLKAVGGFRLENTDLWVQPLNNNENDRGEVKESDILSSGNLIYAINDDMNIRGSYSRTLARPHFREIAPVATYEYAFSYYNIGNPDLERTLIDNYDLRWEWFMRPGEIFAVSGFYKDFHNPIERALQHSENGNITYLNVDDASVIGAEFEFRQRLDRISNTLKWFMLGANLTLIHSEINIPEKRLNELRVFDPDIDDTRPLQGQSPYIINIDLTYDNPETRTIATLAFNTIGKRLYQVSGGQTPDVYEKPATILDFVLKQKIFWGFDFKFKMTNILNSVYRKVYDFQGTDYLREEHQTGKTISFGLSYEI